MLQVILTRFETDDLGTFGRWVLPGKMEVYSAELPYRVGVDGKRVHNRSCIYAGKYRCTWAKSPTRKNPNGSPEYTYRLEDVKDAEGVLVHSGNFAGDVDKGFLSDVEGCIILGAAVLDVEIPPHRLRPGGALRQKGVTSSHDTVWRFVEQTDKMPFELTIKEAFAK